MKDKFIKLENTIKLGLGLGGSYFTTTSIRAIKNNDLDYSIFSSEDMLNVLPINITEIPHQYVQETGEIIFSKDYRILHSVYAYRSDKLSLHGMGENLFLFKAVYTNLETECEDLVLYCLGTYNDVEKKIRLNAFEDRVIFIPGDYDVNLACVKDGKDLKMESFTTYFHELVLGGEDSHIQDFTLPIVNNIHLSHKDVDKSFWRCLDQEQIHRYVSLLGGDRGLASGSIKGTLKIKHIPTDVSETLVSVGTINLQDISRTEIVNIPIYASMGSVGGQFSKEVSVYLLLTDYDRKIHTYQTALVRVPIHNLIKMLENEHMIYSDGLNGSGLTDVITLTAKDDDFRSLMGCKCKSARNDKEKEFHAKSLLFNRHVFGDLKIFGTTQGMGGKQLRHLFSDILGKRVVYAMKHDHIDNLIARLRYLNRVGDVVV